MSDHLDDGHQPAPVDDTPPPDDSGALAQRLAADEPPIDPVHDTRPKVAVVGPLSAAVPPPALTPPPGRPVPAQPPPGFTGPIARPPQPGKPPHPMDAPRRVGAPLLLAGAVFFGSLCICVLLVGLAGFAGYRDGLATNDARITQTLATGIAEQYATGVADLSAGYVELAVARFEWIVETVQAPPEYALDSRTKLDVARTLSAFTATPTATLPPSPTPSLVPTETLPAPTAPESTATPEGPDPAALYDQAAAAMRVVRYEDAIEWLDALQALAPDYRMAEVQAMLLEALVEQGKIYLRGTNADGADQLMRGVWLIKRADEIGEVEPPSWLFEAEFAERYINARNYVNGGFYTAALPVLEQLCEWNCAWSYRGVSVEALLAETRSQTGDGS
jgi:hypothetical protein